MTDAPEFDPDEALNAVKYEYDMAAETALLAATSTERPSAEAFALLESFLVHARNLHDFFRPNSGSRNRRPGDFWASDFVDGFGVETFPQEVVDEMNRRLHHITTWRQGNDHVGWHPLPMLMRVYRSMEEFLEQLDNDLGAHIGNRHRRVAETLRSANLIE